ncbi:amylo-alpha-1,6-glucosidase [Pontibacter sp. G13]|uniref:amylo-alpha-1,6-glucosidase n=1 Tax=Pontibacter sp. G13 TaxID=3074898 RepID=UPI002889E255|nr:amylo-alpha-1,6-glucosidase [Pontibacter sp. G13]WNJ16950.1 amylo-alpha-1,6-glucosidase [Pontibacter sp. G13]
MSLSVSASVLNRFNQATRREWLETNGLGGYASSTVIGTNTRRYHGLLVAATNPPIGRMNMLSKLDETLIIGGHRYELGCNKYRGAISPNGYIFQHAFEKEIFPTFEYHVDGAKLRKTIAAIHGENTTVITYEVLEARDEFWMELLPLTGRRDHHSLTQAHQMGNPVVSFNSETLCVAGQADIPNLFITVPGSDFATHNSWYYQFEYPVEQRRGGGDVEDLFCPGHFTVKMKVGSKLAVVVSIDPTEGRDGNWLIEQELKRRQKLVEDTRFEHPMMRQLALAADQFLVNREHGKKSIIAGYPWFADWGRDTMISLPGLCLATGRFEDARHILHSYAQWIDGGMLPNCYLDGKSEPTFNNVDAALWLFVATHQYLEATDDLGFVSEHMILGLEEILTRYEHGTRYHIRMDHDGLITAGADGVQLTWMDAKAGDWVVTPRRGKAVEINALWYNAWKIISKIYDRQGRPDAAAHSNQRAEAIRDRFIETFWNADRGYLADVVEGDHVDASLRPNQLFALSLPFPLLEENQAAAVLQVVEQHLVTPVGIRSLAPHDDAYRFRYHGDQFERDAAYHQGIVWGWLLGPYFDALIQVKGTWGKRQVVDQILGLQAHLQDACLGSISEIYEAEPPFFPRGCPAQAWSVAEILRVVQTHSLELPVEEVEHSLAAFIKRPERDRMLARAIGW